MKNLFGFPKNFLLISLIISLFVGVFSLFPKSIKANTGDGIDLNLSDFQVSKDNNNWSSSVSNIEAREKVYFYAQFENKGRIEADNLTLKLDMPENTKNPKVSVEISSNSPKDGPSAKDTDSKEVSVSLKEDNYRLFYDSNSAKAIGDFDGDGSVSEISLGGDFLNKGKNIGKVVAGKTISVEFQGYVVATGKLEVIFRAKNITKDGNWDTTVSAESGDTVSYLMELHNKVVGTEAKDVKFKLDWATELANSYKIKAIGSSNNAGSDNSEVTVNFARSDSRIVYTNSSLRISWDQDGDGKADYDEKKINDSNLFGSGVSLPDSKILYGCYNYIAYIYFEGKVEHPETDVWMDKFVSKKDGDYKMELTNHSFKASEKVYFKIEFGNRGTKDISDLKIVDELPSYLTYDSGEGDYDKDANEIVFKIKSLKAGSTDEVRFVAKVKSDMQSGCLDNKAKIYEGKELLTKSKAKFCLQSEGKVLAASTPAKLPETGGGVESLIVGLGMTMLGIALKKVTKNR